MCGRSARQWSQQNLGGRVRVTPDDEAQLIIFLTAADRPDIPADDGRLRLIGR
jgi:hypothetical protein